MLNEESFRNCGEEDAFGFDPKSGRKFRRGSQHFWCDETWAGHVDHREVFWVHPLNITVDYVGFLGASLKSFN